MELPDIIKALSNYVSKQYIITPNIQLYKQYDESIVYAIVPHPTKLEKLPTEIMTTLLTILNVTPKRIIASGYFSFDSRLYINEQPPRKITTLKEVYEASRTYIGNAHPLTMMIYQIINSSISEKLDELIRLRKIRLDAYISTSPCLGVLTPRKSVLFETFDVDGVCSAITIYILAKRITDYRIPLLELEGLILKKREF